MTETTGVAVDQSARTPQFHLLGPVAVFVGGELRTPSALKQRSLIALLLLHANQLLPTERIIDELWGAQPPRSAVAALQTYVSAVRRVLTTPDAVPPGDPRRHPVLETRPNGYVMHVPPGQLDLATFRSLAATGRGSLAAGDCAGAGELFRRALAQWRGPALADLPGTGRMAYYVWALEEERLSVLQQRIGVDLCQGRELEVIGALTELCARYSLQEGFQRQLMAALCLSGRQVEALQVYTKAHRLIVNEAGVEPGPALRAVQLAILQGRMPTDPAHAYCQQAEERSAASQTVAGSRPEAHVAGPPRAPRHRS